MNPADALTAGPALLSLVFMTGLLGSAHCIGMCGGIVAALSLSMGRSGFKGMLFQLAYHAGRLTTYALIGLVLGWVGSMVVLTEGFQWVSRGILIGSDLLLIAAGLISAGLTGRRSPLEMEWLAPTRLLGRGVAYLRRYPPELAALPIGLLFGLLPCGLLYAVALTAAQSAAPVQGALIMLCFGLGTLPALMLLGGAAGWLSQRGRRWMMRAAGLSVALMGLYQLVRHLSAMLA